MRELPSKFIEERRKRQIEYQFILRLIGING